MKYLECGCCGEFHPVKLNPKRARFDDIGPDCRDDENRFTADQLETLEGANWEDQVSWLESCE